MWFKKFSLLLLFIFIFRAQADLRTEPSLNQGDIPTGDVFRKNEWSYNQPPLLAPGWMRWGVTDRLTVQLDFMAWLGGLPDINLKYALLDPANHNLKLAWETMYLYFDAKKENLKDLNDDDEHLFSQRNGSAGFTRINGSFNITETWLMHLSAGVSYSEYYRISSEHRTVLRGRTFRALWDPTAAIGIENRPNARWAFHGGISYGETFVFQENRPRKLQLVYGFRWAPWLEESAAWRKNFRLEVDSVNLLFPDANEGRATIIPVIPFVYWQWIN